MSPISNHLIQGKCRTHRSHCFGIIPVICRSIKPCHLYILSKPKQAKASMGFQPTRRSRYHLPFDSGFHASVDRSHTETQIPYFSLSFSENCQKLHAKRTKWDPGLRLKSLPNLYHSQSFVFSFHGNFPRVGLSTSPYLLAEMACGRDFDFRTSCGTHQTRCSGGCVSS